MMPHELASANAAPADKLRIWRARRSKTAGFVGWLATGVLALNLLIFVFIGVTMYEERLQYEKSAAVMTQNLATALENEIAGIVRTGDVALLAVIEEYARQGAGGRVDKQAFNDFIKTIKARLPYANAIRVADAQGKIQYGSDVPAGAAVDISDREYFVRLHAVDGEDFVISRPQRSRVNDAWVIVLARRLKDAGSAFAGIAFMPIAVKDLTQTLARIDVGRKGSIALRGENLGIIARYPQLSDAGAPVGSNVVSGDLRAAIESGKGSTFRATTPLDGIERIVSYRRVESYPLHIIVGLAREEYLAQWRVARARAFLTAAAFFCVSLSLSWLVFRYWRQLKLASEALEHQAHTDFLTGLANRRFFLESAALELARCARYGKQVSLLMVDIDHFKRINDTYGHVTGDLVLQKFASLCTSALREVDLMGRWGGEEFAVLLPETELARAGEAAERIRRLVATTEIPLAQGLPLKLTVSIGVSAWHDGDDNMDMLINRVDRLLYKAKRAGRNRIATDGPQEVPSEERPAAD